MFQCFDFSLLLFLGALLARVQAVEKPQVKSCISPQSGYESTCLFGVRRNQFIGWRVPPGGQTEYEVSQQSIDTKEGVSLQGLNELLVVVLRDEASTIENLLADLAEGFGTSKPNLKLKEKLYTLVYEELVEELREKAAFLSDATLINVQDYVNNILSSIFDEISQFFQAQAKYASTYRYNRLANNLNKTRDLFEDFSDLMQAIDVSTISEASLLIARFYSDRAALLLRQSSGYNKVGQYFQQQVDLGYAIRLFSLASTIARQS